MKHEKLFTFLTSVILSLILSFSAVGCVVTGFDLPVAHTGLILLTAFFYSTVSALCFLYRRGVFLLIGSGILTGLILWRTDAITQCLALVSRIAQVYDNIYGWGTPNLGAIPTQSTADMPLGFVVCLVILIVSWTITRRKRAWAAILVTLLPLISCVIITDTVPDAICLLFLLFGLVVLIISNTARRSDPARGSLLAALVAIPALIALTVLFMLVPQESYVNQAEARQDALIDWFEEITGQNDGDDSDDVSAGQTVDLTELGPRHLPTHAVMEVTATTDGRLYLREQDYDTYDGRGWTADKHRAESFSCGTLWESAGKLTIRTRQTQDNLFLPYYPLESEILDGGHMVNMQGQNEYEWAYRTLSDNWQAVVNSGGAGQGVFREDDTYRDLPYATKVWASELLESILTNEASATAIANAIGDYVRESAVYDLDTARMPEHEGEFTRWFLEQSESGYCVHFATASAVLMRAAGLEARYVTGYAVETYAGEAVTVTANTAHAWAEYYEPMLGAWVVLESTPADLNAPQTTASTQPLPSTAESESEEPSVPSTPVVLNEITVSSASNGTAPSGSQGFALPTWIPRVLIWMFSALLLLAVIHLQRKLRLHRRARKLHDARPNERALLYWRESVRISRLLKRRPDEELKHLAEKAKFSPHTLTPEELKTFTDHLTTARRELKAHPWYKQAIYRYILAIY